MVSAIMFLGSIMLDYDMQCGCPFVTLVAEKGPLVFIWI